MLCENLFCIYWSNDECVLDNISLDIQGSCTSCIYVNIDESILKSQRKNITPNFQKSSELY